MQKTYPVLFRRAAIPALAALLCSACAAADAPAGAGTAAGETRVVEILPLRPGYYIATDRPCAEASNSSLHLLREDGSGYGGFTTPPYFCAFQRIEQAGPSTFRAVEVCGNGHGEGDDQTMGVVYEILDDTRYRARNDDGWESSARRCPRRELPALWREGGLGDFVD